MDNPPDDVQSPLVTKPGTVAAATSIIVAVTILLCLIPFASADLFWQLRAGHDILHDGHVPHADAYSWFNHGTRWVAPEWLSFVVFWMGYRAGGFFGTWLVMVLLALATVMVVWFWLLRRVGAIYAFIMTNLMLLAMVGFFQERPYLFTYLFLAAALIVVIGAREKGLRRLLWLVPLCALWANFHQGGLALTGLLLAYALGDAITAAVLRWKSAGPESRHYACRALAFAATAVGCLATGMISPYGWRVYWNVLITVRDRVAMSMVQEWRPVTSVPVATVWGFYLLAGVIVFGYAWSRHRRDLGETLVVAALFVESCLHLRNVPLFAIGSVLLASPHVVSAAQTVWRRTAVKSTAGTPVNRPLSVFAAGLIYVITVARICLPPFIDQVGVKGITPTGIGEAVIGLNWFPSSAVEFMESEGFPPGLRIFNDYNIGGFLIFELPTEPVFVDSRADVYIGRTLNDYMTVFYGSDSKNRSDILNRYDFDCIVTTDGGVAQRFAYTPGWELVYGEPPPIGPRARGFILLRTRRQYRDLIARCVRDCDLFHSPQ